MAEGKQFATLVNHKILIAGVVIFFAMVFGLNLQPGHPQVTFTAAVAVLMALWWVTEAIPIAVTSLLPIVLFPIMGVMDGKDVSNAYINYVIFLFIGGFVMALAMERWELHRRIALWILSKVGGAPFMIIFGFMLASAFLSMWMSNTATAMMMLPIALSVSNQLDKFHGEEKTKSLNVAILIGIAYACSIGGVATLVGTPPNLSLVRIFNIIFPEGPEISFGEWLIFALPLVVVMFAAANVLLYLMFRPKKGFKKLEKRFFRGEYRKLGSMTTEQKRVLVIFVVLVLLWVSRKSLEIGNFSIPGWSEILPVPEYINDGTVAIFIAFILFITPSSKKRKGLVDWETARRIPWRIVLLFGGGFALAQAFVASGLSTYIGEQLASAGQLSSFSLVGLMAAVMTGLTEFTSNTATTEMLLPVVAGVAVQIQINPLLVMIPITLAGSMAFMFPIATPPNAIVFGSERISMWDMAKAGIFLNIIAITLITCFMYFWGVVVFQIDFSVFPDWAIQNAMNTH
ncbi:SLC13 family permease [Sunxiuqinia sp. A32]|uniref:SLC13 family permease n=1 Tax=Sunxiuqinia sp. A32 TaxID=3461496 RepID=UPI004045EBDA